MIKSSALMNQRPSSFSVQALTLLAFIGAAGGHLDILSVPDDKLCFHHSRHTGISPEIIVQNGQSKKLSQSLLRIKRDTRFVSEYMFIVS